MKILPAWLMLTILACSGIAAPSTTAAPNEPEPDRLLAELAAAGPGAQQEERFSTDPLGGEGILVCLGAEEVRVYLFPNEEEAVAAAARIDPQDPTNVGNAIVEWAGNPRFWRRGPLLVLYLGDDESTENLLTEVLGSPFARGAGSGRGLPGLPGPCLNP